MKIFGTFNVPDYWLGFLTGAIISLAGCVWFLIGGN